MGTAEPLKGYGARQACTDKERKDNYHSACSQTRVPHSSITAKSIIYVQQFFTARWGQPQDEVSMVNAVWLS